jgi:hypothetical protein
MEVDPWEHLMEHIGNLMGTPWKVGNTLAIDKEQNIPASFPIHPGPNVISMEVDPWEHLTEHIWEPHRNTLESWKHIGNRQRAKYSPLPPNSKGKY